MFTYLLYCMEILDEGEAVKWYNRQTKDRKKKQYSGTWFKLPKQNFLTTKSYNGENTAPCGIHLWFDPIF